MKFTTYICCCALFISSLYVNSGCRISNTFSNSIAADTLSIGYFSGATRFSDISKDHKGSFKLSKYLSQLDGNYEVSNGKIYVAFASTPLKRFQLFDTSLEYGVVDSSYVFVGNGQSGYELRVINYNDRSNKVVLTTITFADTTWEFTRKTIKIIKPYEEGVISIDYMDQAKEVKLISLHPQRIIILPNIKLNPL